MRTEIYALQHRGDLPKAEHGEYDEGSQHAGNTTRFRRPNHNAAPTNPPIAAVVSGMATPCTAAWNIITLAGRSPAVTPVANCGASRISVPAAVKLIAPSDPITKPSNDSRVGRTSRITTAGTSMRIAPPTGTPIPTSCGEPSGRCVSQ